MRRDALQVDPATVPELLAAPGAYGSFEAVRVEDAVLSLRAQASATAALGYGVLVLLIGAGLLALLKPLGWKVWLPIAIPALVLAGWATAQIHSQWRPAVLVVAQDRVIGAPSSWFPRTIAVEPAAIEAVLLVTAQVRPSSGSGQHSLSWIALTRKDGGPALRGPRSEDRALAAWAEGRDQLLPLALELSRRLSCPLRLRYEGWPDTKEPIQREVAPTSGR